MATIAAGHEINGLGHSWATASQSYEVACGTESRAAEIGLAERLRLWRDGSQYIKGITPMPTTPCVGVSPCLDFARRRAIWDEVTPVVFLFTIVSGIATTSAGLPVMLGVMAGVFVVTAAVGRLAWSS